MADDPYEVLGVARNASADEIRRAFREGAKKNHPDLNPGDRDAEARFKTMSAAHELLSDPETRARFDRGEIDGSGQPRAPERPSYRDFAEGEQGTRYRTSGRPAGGWRTEDLGDIFSSMFGEAGAAPTGPARGRDERYALSVDFLDAVRGGTRRLTLPDGRTLDVAIPAGIESGRTLRIRGRGGAGRNGGADGDALIEIHVADHAFFRRAGNDIRLSLPLTLREAVLGARVTVPTPDGPVAMTVPARSDSGRVLRLRGRGIPAHPGAPAGDLLVTLAVTIADADDQLAAFLRDWTTGHPADPRREMTGAP